MDAVLGDDVLIADELVGPVYADLVQKLGVAISYHKSLTSRKGCAEFAKKFLVNNLEKDLSPISVAELSNYYTPYGAYGLHMKYRFKRFSTFCRISGVGYRGLSSLTKPSTQQ